MTRICLTPESPDYDDTRWDVHEHSDAEAIVATGIYVFDCENISPQPRIALRVNVKDLDTLVTTVYSYGY